MSSVARTLSKWLAFFDNASIVLLTVSAKFVKLPEETIKMPK